MVQNFHMPPTGFGPGSQADANDGPELEYMALPSGMRTYAPKVPYLEATAHLRPALDLMRDVSAACRAVSETGTLRQVDLRGLDAQNRALVAETMGDGEVSMKIRGVPALMVQESVFAGIWQVAGAGTDRLDIAPVPTDAIDRAFAPVTAAKGAAAPGSATVVNAPALIAELLDKSAGYQAGQPPHVINLTLLPHTEDDLLALDQAMGQGSVTVLSRGYGNCRVSATATPHVWRVQFFNSMDVLILDTFEVGGMPEVAIAAPEDLCDSGKRLADVVEAIT